MARSPAYPGIDLEQAIEAVQIIYDREGLNATQVDVVKKHLGYKSTSGTGNIVVSALAKFGLVEAEGTGEKRTLRVTPSTQEILLLFDDEPDRQQLIREAALRPKIHQALYDEYKGDLPSDESLKSILRSRHSFTASGAEDFVDVFRATLSFAGLSDPDSMSNNNGDDRAMSTQTPSRSESRVQSPSPKGFEIAISPSSSLVFTGDFPLGRQLHERLKKLLDIYEDDLIGLEAISEGVAKVEDTP